MKKLIEEVKKNIQKTRKEQSDKKERFEKVNSEWGKKTEKRKTNIN